MHDPPLILIVDDNPVNRDIIVARLRAAGYSTIEAGDGSEAIAVAQARQPDLILLDVMMPRLDGLEVSRRLKADTRMPFTPIILVTARTEDDDVVNGLAAGADEYITKPVNQKALVARVAAMLRIKAAIDRQLGTPPAHASSDVFLSYSRPDRDRVGELARAMEDSGFSIWWDRDLVAGASFDRVIEDAIAAARAVVVVWSYHSVRSDWVRAEAVFALEASKLIPVRIDAAVLPLRFTHTHTIDLSGPGGIGTSPEMGHLLEQVQRAVRPAGLGGPGPGRGLPRLG